MSHTISSRLPLLAITLAVAALSRAAAARADDYAIDPAHTSAAFSVRHMMVSTVRGQFSGVTGKVHYDPTNIGATTIEVTIDTSTVNTQKAERDAHLRSADFLDVAQYKTMTFKSTSVSKNSDGTLKVIGDLTLRGVTRPVELRVDGPTAPMKDPWGKLRAGASATTKINRSDFGLKWNKTLEAGGVLVGDEVTITLDIEALKA